MWLAEIINYHKFILTEDKNVLYFSEAIITSINFTKLTMEEK